MMFKRTGLMASVVLFLLLSQAFAGEDSLKNKAVPVFEIVKWQSRQGVVDHKMISAVERMAPDIQTLPGFIHQTLYKSVSGEWVAIYYWETEEDAHASNTSMAGKGSFKALMALIEPESVFIEVMHPLQLSGNTLFQAGQEIQ